MRQKRFLLYFLIEILVIISVVFIFKLNSDTKMASVQAGVLFVLLPVFLGMMEWKKSGFSRKSFYIGLLQFWILFALPILGLRLLNWDTPFSELSVLGIQGTSLHQYANFSYLVVVAVTLWNYGRRE